MAGSTVHQHEGSDYVTLTSSHRSTTGRSLVAVYRNGDLVGWVFSRPYRTTKDWGYLTGTEFDAHEMHRSPYAQSSRRQAVDELLFVLDHQ